MNIPQYLDTLQRRYSTGNAREHAYRADLEALLRHLAPGVEVTNEPANVTDCGNQPAQKWLKDRRERVLAFDDLLHYQRIVAALGATERLMGEIDQLTTI